MGLIYRLLASPRMADTPTIGLIVKTDTNSFFVKMKEAARIEVVVEFIRTGKKPENTPGLDFHDTGVTLVTDELAPGIPSISSKQNLKAY